MEAAVILEFTGAPGSGKSTLAKEMVRVLRNTGLRGLPASEAARAIFQQHTSPRLPCLVDRPLWYGLLVWHGLRFAGEHRGLARLVISSQRARPVPLRLRSWITYRLLLHCGQHRLLNRYLARDQVAIVDGGLLHYAATLFTSERERAAEERLRAYVNLLPARSPLVVVQVPEAVCLQRARQRSRQPLRRFDGLTAEQTEAFILNQADALSRAVAAARQAGWTILSVDNTGDLTHSVEQLRVQLVNMIQQKPKG